MFIASSLPPPFQHKELSPQSSNPKTRLQRREEGLRAQRERGRKEQSEGDSSMGGRDNQDHPGQTEMLVQPSWKGP